MTSTKRVRCPHCSAAVVVTVDPWDKLLDCPVCDKRFQVSQGKATK